MEKTPKIFISHSSKDQQYAELMIDLLHGMGQCDWNNSVFCSSIAGYDIPLRNRIYDYIKKEFDTHELYVLFLLSENFYNSYACLNEMGAAWITNKRYCMILLPGFSFKQIGGVVDPTAISIDLNQSQKLNQLTKLHDDIIDFLKIDSTNQYEWERKREQFINAIKKKTVDLPKIQKYDPLDIQIINFLSSKGEDGASFSEIRSFVPTHDPRKVVKRLKSLVEDNILFRRGDTRSSRWFLSKSNQVDIFMREIKRLETRINSIPDYSKPSEWTP